MNKVGFLLVVVCFVQLSLTWGPLSHYYFSCNIFDGGNTMSDCLDDPGYQQLIIGSDAPDSYYFGSFSNLPGCDSYAYMHDPVFAGSQLLFALNYNGANESLTQTKKLRDWLAGRSNFNINDYNPYVQYSLGYGSHIFSDLPGFTAAGGKYGLFGIGPETIWIPTWQYMIAIDSYVAQNNSLTDIPPFVTYLDIENFVVDATKNYQENGNPGFQPVNNTIIRDCSSNWSRTVGNVTANSIEFPKAGYEYQMVFYDTHNADNFDEALEHVTKSMTCGIESVNYWLNELLNNNESPLTATVETTTYLTKLLLRNQCV
eukprot:TRINITY_DN93_c1_g1_i1.p1 TRINITY_DN93_c1_g1~~TRINITY_DN93_c1_g1_i1.p1  ORF type:complete len:322 (-),score=99.62 TRINITY_DN93_c1_g1_i1:169-1113(-)